MLRVRVGAVVAAVGSLMIGAVVAGGPVEAARPIYLPTPQKEKPLPRHEVSLTSRHHGIPHQKAAVRSMKWLAAASATIVKAPAGASATVQPMSRAVSRSLGLDGPVFKVGASARGRARISLDYSGFEQLYGGNWSSRLHAVQLPDCALTTPNLARCRTATPIPNQIEPASSHVVTDVDLAPSSPAAAATAPAATTPGARATASRTTAAAPATAAASTGVVALAAGPSGAGGDFTATSLAPSGSWSMGGATGGFSWSYPLTLPSPGTGSDVVPSLALGYDSQAVDGQNSASNTQPSWVGEGWDLGGGYVERTYRTCSDDTTLGSADKTPDSCWAGQILTLHMPGGSTTAIVKDDNTDTWRPQSDDGNRVERKTGADNGSYQGEYWVVTTKDGTQYTFGREMLPGAAAGDRTNSAWTMPVFSPKSADPCNGEPGKHCAMAYRWNLDSVQDVHGNTAVYSYAQESNYYKSKGASDSLLKYVRGGYLTSIRYGLSAQDGGLFATAPQKVSFEVQERCWPYTDPDTGKVHGCSDADFKDDPAAWYDTPADQNCESSGSCDNTSPTFWTRKRLSKVTTSYWDGNSYQDVDSYALSQSFHQLGDNEMVLDGITRTGLSASPSITAPPVVFTYDQRDNHVNGVQSQPSMLHQRLITITSETGQVVAVHYADEPGQAGRAKPMCTKDTIPAAPASNTTECFPVKWTPYGYTDPILDYFHKYVVTEVDITDKNGTAPTRPTTYTYVGDPAWHYDDNEVERPKYRSWGQFRGYAEVDVRSGDPQANIVGAVYGGTNDKQTLTKTFYLRGMDGDKTATGTRSASVTTSENGTITDADQYSGMVYETQDFNGSGGAQITKTITTPTTVATTATRARDDLPALKATIVRTARTDSYTVKAAGGRMTSSAASTYDTRGRALEVTSTASDAVTNCVKTTYVDNDTLWVRDKASEVRTYEVTCPTTATPSPTLLKDSRTYYDGATTLGSIGLGDPTRQEDAKTASTWVAKVMTYDGYGRTKSVKVLNPGASSGDRLTTTAYTPAGVGALTKVTTTLPDATQVQQKWLDPARGIAIKAQGADNLVTEGTFDALGRLTAVWQPGQVKGVDQASEKYSYQIGPDQPLAVTTQTLIDPGNGVAPSYRTQVQIYDAFGALRQAQAQAAGNTVTVTDSFRDTHGWSVKDYDHWFTIGSPSTTLLGGINETQVDGWRVTTYDGTGRPTTVTSRKGSSTITGTVTTVYGGDRVTMLPPAGGIAYTAINNGRGQKIEFDQYTTTPTRSGDVISGGAPQIEKYTYDGAGRQKTQVTAYGTAQAATWTNTYDLLGRVTDTTSPDAGATHNTYFDSGEVATAKDANSKTIAFDYDVMGRPIGKYATSLTGAKLASWSYDTLLKGRLTSSAVTVGGATYTKSVTGYDSAGHPLGTSVSLNRTGFNPSYTTTQTWTSTGLQATSTLAASQTASGAGLTAETLNYGYDEVGNARTMTGTNAYVSASTYSPYGEATQLVLGVNDQTGSLNFTRDTETRNVTEATLTGQSTNPQIEKMAYTYDPSGNVTKLIDTQGGTSTSPTETHCFNYDSLKQLREAWSSTDACATRPSVLGNTTKVGGPQPYSLYWEYDAAGNRTKQVNRKTGTMTADETTTYTVGGTGYSVHQLAKADTKLGTATTAATSRTFKYDPAGNVTTRTITSGSTTETTGFSYGADGTIDTATVGTNTSKYVRDADGQILLRADTSGTTTTTTLFLPGQEVSVATTGTTVGATTVTRYYAFDGVNVGMRVNKGNVRYLMADRNGTNQVAVNPLDWTVIRRTLDPFGNQVGATTPSGSSFPGGHTFLNKPYVTLTKLVDIGARLYDSAVGRFTSVDPELAPDDPQQANGYAYSDNNPVTFADPTGRMLLAEGGGSSSDSTLSACQPGPPPGTEQFRTGFVRGAGDQAKAIVESLYPSNIASGIKNLLDNAVHNPIKTFWGIIKSGVKSLTHIDDFKDAYDAFKDEDWERLGEITGKLVVEIGGDIAATLIGAGAAKLLKDGLKEADAASHVTSELDDVAGGVTTSEASVGYSDSTDYRGTFFGENPDLQGQVVVHHAVEQQVLKRYPGLFDVTEIHSLENLRGIPLESNNTLHLSQIRRSWNGFYRTNPAPTREDVLSHATEVDRLFGSQFLPPIG
jgi:RHS repeat-associated protein